MLRLEDPSFMIVPFKEAHGYSQQNKKPDNHSKDWFLFAFGKVHHGGHPRIYVSGTNKRFPSLVLVPVTDER